MHATCPWKIGPVAHWPAISCGPLVSLCDESVSSIFREPDLKLMWRWTKEGT